MIARVSLTGIGGTVATIGLSQWSDILGIIAGALTCIYLSIKIVQAVGK